MMDQIFKPLHPGDIVSAVMVKRISDGLRDCTLPKPEWTHGAHLTAGAALLEVHGIDGAKMKMPAIIRAYNEATGVPNTDDEGYHHTITLFYLRKIDEFMKSQPDAPLHIRITNLLAAPLAERPYPLNYYSKALLFSVEARRNWVEPDLNPLSE